MTCRRCGWPTHHYANHSTVEYCLQASRAAAEVVAKMREALASDEDRLIEFVEDGGGKSA